MKNNYYIVPVEDISILYFNEIVEIEPTLINETHFVCKTIIGSNVVLDYPKYTHKEILSELSKIEEL
jgi:hypothetical protein